MAAPVTLVYRSLNQLQRNNAPVEKDKVPTDQFHQLTGTTPAELIARGKQKYAMGVARLRREQQELALLSLLGSLEDILRGHLSLHRSLFAEHHFLDLLDTLSHDVDSPLLPDEIAGLRRMHSLRLRIAQGESVTITQESLAVYHQFVAALLPRYGVPVASPDSPPPSTRENRFPMERRKRPRWQNYLTPVLSIALIFIVGAAATVALQRTRSFEPGQSIAATPFAPQITTRNPQSPSDTGVPPPSAPSDGLAPGQPAYVIGAINDGLALRSEPSSTADIRLFLSANTAVEVLAGPVDVDGYAWWQVRAANIEGWCAGEFLEVR